MSNDKKWAFIINPIAGNGFARKYTKTIEEKIEKHKLNYSIAFTEKKGHAVKLASDFAVKEYTHIIAVGGDGTINETATGIMDHKVTFGVIPAGTGNDFVPILGFNEHFTDEDWQKFFQENTINMDVGICNDNYFINGMGLGFDAQVASENYKDGQVKKGGAKKYFWHIIKTLLFYKEKPMSVISEEDEIQSLCFINTIGNGRRVGGGYFLTPLAVANDGYFDICMVEKLSLIERFILFTKVPKGEHINDKKVKYYTTNKLLIRFNEKVPYHLDGEMYFDEQFIINIIPQKLKIIYNPEGEHYFNKS